MNEHMAKQFRRFKAYTWKLAWICITAALVISLLLPKYRWLGGLCLVAGVSALVHHCYLRISLHAYDRQKHHKE